MVRTFLESIGASSQVAVLLISETHAPEKPPRIIYTGKEDITIDTELQEAETDNRNRRNYTRKALMYGMSTEYFLERVRTQSLYGEAGHPFQPTIERQLYIDQNNIAFTALNPRWEGNKIMSKVLTAREGPGRQMKGLIEQGSLVAFSMRGVGSVTEQKGEITLVKDPLNIYCWDWVIHPSYRTAYMDPNSRATFSESSSAFRKESSSLAESMSNEDFIRPVSNSELARVISASPRARHIASSDRWGSSKFLGLTKQGFMTFKVSESETLVVKPEEHVMRTIHAEVFAPRKRRC